VRVQKTSCLSARRSSRDLTTQPPHWSQQENKKKTIFLTVRKQFSFHLEKKKNIFFTQSNMRASAALGGRVAVVAGASRGIGLATARLLAQRHQASVARAPPLPFILFCFIILNFFWVVA
jgi:hypothetical protein